MGYRIAVVGATGTVGRELLEILATRRFPVGQIDALASRTSVGKEVSFGEGKKLKVQDLEQFNFEKVDLAFFMAGGEISKKYASKATKVGAIVIDNSSHYRMDPDVPLIVSEVNMDAIEGVKKKRIIANPNCSTIQMLVALKPLHDVATIKRIIVCTYQSVSGAGRRAMDELFSQTRAVFVNDPIEKKAFTKQIAFNVIPHIDVFMDDGQTKEEWKMVVETKKILDKQIKVSASCVRVPVFVGHGEAVHLAFENEMSSDEARRILREAPGVSVIDHRMDEGYATPHEVAGEDAVFVSRIRDDISVPHGLAMWIVSDNIRKGAALNAVQIAEGLIAHKLL